MKSENGKRVISKAIVLSLCSCIGLSSMAATSWSNITANAVDTVSSDVNIIQPGSISSSNTNIEKQNYRYGTWYYSWNWANTVESYMIKTADGYFMTVQKDSDGNYKATYYTSQYKLNKSLTINKELAIFGGFYEGTDGYYIISGQENPDESASVECFRITKYDKNWNRISSAGLYDCNTIVPFDAGSLRVAEYGDYLVIRTCHKMYKSDDGLNHQANVTIEYCKSTSQITDSFTEVMNTEYGYASHSFNQFIHIEDGKIVAVDHGDAYPRSVGLIKYNTQMTSGKFVPGYYTKCTVIDALPFKGSIGANYTGATVGGFEISDSSYLIAGSSEPDPGEESETNVTRNIFVSTVSKSNNTVKTKYLTDLSSSSLTANNPQLVKVNNNKFVLMWTTKNVSTRGMSYSGNMYYAVLDGNGNLVGSIKNGAGYISDCHPIVDEGKVKWYVYSGDRTVFFTLDPDTLALSQTEANAFSNSSTVSSTSIMEGESVKLTAKATGGKAPYTYTYRCRKSGTTTWKYLATNTTTTTFSYKPNSSGTYEVQVIVKDANSQVATKGFKINVKAGLKNSSTISSTSIMEGTAVKLTAKATGGVSPYTYTYRCRKSGTTTWKYLATNTTKTALNYKPGSSGTYEIQVLVKDAKSKVVSKGFTLNVKPALKNNSTISATSVKAGASVKLTAKATGGKTPYTYTYRCRKSGTTTWKYLAANVSTTNFTYKPNSAGTYEIQVLVKDADSTVVSKGFTLKVTA